MLKQPKKLLIDTDPGIDDALAILMALGAGEELCLDAVTTVAGNVPLAQTTANALSILALADAAHIPVIAGADKPLNWPLHMAVENHGDDGLGNLELPPLKLPPVAGHDAAAFLAKTIMAAPPGTYTLCCLGPLTNLAGAIRIKPEIATRLAEIVISGGTIFAEGNVTPTAEFNFYVDPDAAEIVLGAAGAKLTIIPWDASRTALTSAARRARLASIGEPLGPVIAEMLDFYRRYDEAAWGTDGGALPDPLTIAYLLAPELFAGSHIALSIESQDPALRGTLYPDWYKTDGRPANALVLKDVDVDGYFTLLTERLAVLNGRLSDEDVALADTRAG